MSRAFSSRFEMLDMEWLQFEHEIRDLVEAFGYQAESTAPSHDFGVDVIARSNRRIVVIQCKLYGKCRIGGDTMMKLVGSRQYFKATDAICITTSRFTKQAQEIANKEDIKLIDGAKIVLLCKERNLTIPSLTVLITPTEEICKLQATETTLGRDATNHIILSSPLASRRHAVFTRTKLQLSLSDCGSTNGTEVNGQCIAGTVALTYGDTISLSGIIFIVAMQTPSGLVLANK